MVYVLLLGWLQHRRFDREAAARGTTLAGTPGMLGGALRLAAAAAIATALGLLARGYLMQWLPGMQFVTLLLRTALLCMVGLGAYAILARLFGVRELVEAESIVLRKLRLR